jgi:hypothetical protein
MVGIVAGQWQPSMDSSRDNPGIAGFQPTATPLAMSDDFGPHLGKSRS